jgi:hypothetical protein
MAYGDYNGPDKPNKGHEGGACNRQLCQHEPANWFNHGSRSWYCDTCRHQIEFDAFNYRDWKANHEPDCGHPMFETRQMMDVRDGQQSPYNGIKIKAIADDDLETARLFQPGNCLRATNPRVVVCHCAECGGE